MKQCFFICKVCIFWNCIQYTLYIEIIYTIYWDKIQISFGRKEAPLEKINGTKNAFCFLLRAPTHHSFTFNLRFLYELKLKVRLSKNISGIFHFRFRFAFIKVYIFVQQNAWTLWFWSVITPFKIKIISEPHTVLLPNVWVLSCNKKFSNSMISAWVGAPKNWLGDKFFKPRKLKFWKRLNSNF